MIGINSNMISEKEILRAKDKSRQFRKKNSIVSADIDILYEEELKKKYLKEQSDEECKKMQDKIKELIKAGKSSGAIKQTIKKLYPKITDQMESEKINLGDGKTTDRLSMQIEYRVEEFRKSIPKHYEDDRR